MKYTADDSPAAHAAREVDPPRPPVDAAPTVGTRAVGVEPRVTPAVIARVVAVESNREDAV